MDEPPKHYDEKMRERLADDLANIIIFVIASILIFVPIIWLTATYIPAPSHP